MYHYKFKYILVGDSGSGKTSFVNHFVEEFFNSSYDMTIGVDFLFKTKMYQDKTIKFQIWDTAGQEIFRSLTSCYYKGATAILLFYDVTRSETFKSLRTWVEHVDEHGSKETLLFLIGNKKDLEKKRKVTREQGENFAKDHNMSFLEISSKEFLEVNQVFDITANILLNDIKAHGPTSSVIVDNTNRVAATKRGEKDCCHFI